MRSLNKVGVTASATGMTVGAERVIRQGSAVFQAGRQARHEDVMRGAEGGVSRSEYDDRGTKGDEGTKRYCCYSRL